MRITKFVILVGFSIVSLIMVSLFFTYQTEVVNEEFNPEHIYRTWKVSKFYKNGKLVLNDDKYDNLRLKVNRNGTAEWIKNGQVLPISFKITPDGSQIIIDDGYSIEDIETIYELNSKKFRFGKRNSITHYEYVMVPFEFEK